MPEFQWLCWSSQKALDFFRQALCSSEWAPHSEECMTCFNPKAQILCFQAQISCLWTILHFRQTICWPWRALHWLLYFTQEPSYFIQALSSYARSLASYFRSQLQVAFSQIESVKFTFSCLLFSAQDFLSHGQVDHFDFIHFTFQPWAWYTPFWDD